MFEHPTIVLIKFIILLKIRRAVSDKMRLKTNACKIDKKVKRLVELKEKSIWHSIV